MFTDFAARMAWKLAVIGQSMDEICERQSSLSEQKEDLPYCILEEELDVVDDDLRVGPVRSHSHA